MTQRLANNHRNKAHLAVIPAHTEVTTALVSTGIIAARKQTGVNSWLAMTRMQVHSRMW